MEALATSIEEIKPTIREQIIETLKTVERQGIHDLISYLENTDYFTAPSSTMYHLSCLGGLAKHSWNVYRLLTHKVKIYGFESLIPPDSITICALCHDLCKINFYHKIMKSKKEGYKSNGKANWIDIEAYDIEDQFPYGHGEKSVSILQDFIKVEPEEKLAIRWHMGAFEVGTMLDYGQKSAYNKAKECSPLVALLATADMEASAILEGGWKSDATS
ncbi:MAG: HD domain-containing protein [Anaerovoracaceae bacterium]